MPRTLTPREIEACRTVGRDEARRTSTIGLAELDALCDTALRGAATEAQGDAMKIRVTFDLDDHCLQALRHHWGKKGLANYDEAETWIEMAVTGTLNEVILEYEASLEDAESGA